MKTNVMTEALYQYVLDHCPLPHELLDDLKKETLGREDAMMQISEDQGAFLNFMTRLVGAKTVLEIGCFTGYSTICMATALPPTGTIISLDINEETTNIAKKYLERAGCHDRYDIRIGPALDSLDSLLETQENQFDLVFIDADKENMYEYFERSLRLVKTGGLIIADNVLWGGSVIDGDNQKESTLAIREFNNKIKLDHRIDATLLHIADGLYLIRKR